MPTQTVLTVGRPTENWYDHQLANDEPSCLIVGFECQAESDPAIRRIQFGFCWPYSMRGPTAEVEGFDEFERFRTIRPGDVLEVVYRPATTRPKRPTEILSTIRGQLRNRGPALFPARDRSGEIVSIRHVTQGWEIAERRLSDSDI